MKQARYSSHVNFLPLFPPNLPKHTRDPATLTVQRTLTSDWWNFSPTCATCHPLALVFLLSEEGVIITALVLRGCGDNEARLTECTISSQQSHCSGLLCFLQWGTGSSSPLLNGIVTFEKLLLPAPFFC